MAFTGGDTNGLNMTALVAAAGGDKVETKVATGTVRCFSEYVLLAAQAKSKTIGIGYTPAGSVPLYGIIVTDTSLSTAEIAIGSAADPDKYRLSAVLTATDAPELYSRGIAPTDGAGDEVSADEELFITNSATAALPGAGELRNFWHYMNAQ